MQGLPSHSGSSLRSGCLRRSRLSPCGGCPRHSGPSLCKAVPGAGATLGIAGRPRAEAVPVQQVVPMQRLSPAQPKMRNEQLFVVGTHC
jgi:hypothetical protein